MMWRVPSVAVGSVQPQSCPEPMVWALLGAVAQSGLSVQAFASSAIPDPRPAVAKITGRPLRFLDGWLQDEEQTLAAWCRGAADCQAAVVYGSHDESGAAGDLTTLCRRLGLPPIAVVDVSALDGCLIPHPPDRLSGILLDRVGDARNRIAWQTQLESFWSAPVLGWLEESLPARRMADFLPAEQTPSTDLLKDLAAALAPTLQCDRLAKIAQRSPWWPTPFPAEPKNWNHRCRVRVAVAFDEAFPCYSADTLQLLEGAGACVRDFSPLRCERLPEDADVVLIGTGTSDRFWRELARNCCLQQSLRSFAAGGGRVYAEGSGLAYVSRQVVLADGCRIPAVGLLAAEAHQGHVEQRYTPASAKVAFPSWLFADGQELRGYRDAKWQIVRSSSLSDCTINSEGQIDMVASGNVIGSRIVLHFASRPAMLRQFLASFARRPRLAGAVR